MPKNEGNNRGSRNKEFKSIFLRPKAAPVFFSPNNRKNTGNDSVRSVKKQIDSVLKLVIQ